MGAATCTQHAPKSAPGTTVYRRRQPERSVIYQVMQGHLESWLAGYRQADEEGSAVATHIEQDFRKYLECGILALPITHKSSHTISIIFQQQETITQKL